jgi:REP element-mobilizing transposase RayT
VRRNRDGATGQDDAAANVERMPRQPRIQVASGMYHVNASACEGQLLFRDAADRNSFEALVASTVSRLAWSCLSICLMDTHYHLLVVTLGADLAAGIQRINGLYGQTFNRRHGSSGHVFKARYHSEFIQTEGHLFEVCRYIALNPVRAGICESPADWPWSSYAETVGLRSPRPYVASEELLRLFADDLQLARSRFQAFTEEGLGRSGRGQLRVAS